ncbi:unnamed protein product [Amoebophrya sp. A25]|nr:unnamed protein product [Amoebophrya sp. A25]|eukprot:GSA25T00026940001.1
MSNVRHARKPPDRTRSKLRLGKPPIDPNIQDFDLLTSPRLNARAHARLARFRKNTEDFLSLMEHSATSDEDENDNEPLFGRSDTPERFQSAPFSLPTKGSRTSFDSSTLPGALPTTVGGGNNIDDIPDSPAEAPYGQGDIVVPVCGGPETKNGGKYVVESDGEKARSTSTGSSRSTPLNGAAPGAINNANAQEEKGPSLSNSSSGTNKVAPAASDQAENNASTVENFRDTPQRGDSGADGLTRSCSSDSSLRRNSSLPTKRSSQQSLVKRRMSSPGILKDSEEKKCLVLGGRSVVGGNDEIHDFHGFRKQNAKEVIRTLRKTLEAADQPNIASGRSLIDMLFGSPHGIPQTNLEDDSLQDWYRKTAGLHTVQKWLENYQKHPYGWGALMMIHGTDEVCFRLRTKVENYAVYAALFVSASIVLMLQPVDRVSRACEFAKPEQLMKDGDPFWFVCHVQTRMYFYGLAFATAAHILAILLAMAFINAFNEAGRDCDIIRMFGEGKGYLATVKCERAFTCGLLALGFAVFSTLWLYLSIFDAIFIVLLWVFVGYRRIYVPTVNLLFSSSSLIHYWRWGRGHRSGRDPFILDVPMERLQQKCAIARMIHAGVSTNMDTEEDAEKQNLWES